MTKIYVKWCDANSNAEWFTIEEALKWAESEEWEVETIGFVLSKNDEYILLCQGYSGEICRGLLKIPTTWIREYKVLKFEE